MRDNKMFLKILATNSAGLAWGIVVTLILIGAIIAVLIYYRRRVANLKAEINHVVNYISEAPGHFDNPVYAFQPTPSVVSDTSTLLSNGIIKNNLRTNIPNKPSNLDRYKCQDDDSDASSKGRTFLIYNMYIVILSLIITI